MSRVAPSLVGRRNLAAGEKAFVGLGEVFPKEWAPPNPDNVSLAPVD